MEFQILKGMKDVLPDESYRWQYVESVIRESCARHGFCEARTPVLEHTGLFARGVGEVTDIVQKEMYTFEDKGGRSVTLKPEGTAGLARMYVEHKLFSLPAPQKMYYLNAPIFRYERPQAGRLREHHQFGVELYGSPLAAADAECIALVFEILGRLGIGSLKANINSIGCPNCRPEYNRRLKEYLADNLDGMCATCKTRFETNPLRILDCKEPHCREICAGAPHTIDCLCDDCAAHFEDLKTHLDTLGVPYEVDSRIVRGLDYYTKTVFEIVSDTLGAQSTVCGGGRYDGLVEQVGGPATPAVGFGLGLERLLLTLENMNAPMPDAPSTCVYIVSSAAPETLAAALRLTRELRERNITAEFDHVGRSFKAQFKYADKIGARFVVIIGEDELAKAEYSIKDMAASEQLSVAACDIADYIAARK